jgi:hypothetical protein
MVAGGAGLTLVNVPTRLKKTGRVRARGVPWLARRHREAPTVGRFRLWVGNDCGRFSGLHTHRHAGLLAGRWIADLLVSTVLPLDRRTTASCLRRLSLGEWYWDGACIRNGPVRLSRDESLRRFPVGSAPQ